MGKQSVGFNVADLCDVLCVVLDGLGGNIFC